MSAKLYGLKETLAPFTALLFSAGTLVCCTLPAIMVSLGMGAVLAGWISAFPQLVWLSQYKTAVFGIAAAAITFAWIMQVRARTFPCPTDPKQAKACNTLRKISWIAWWLSLFLFIVGFFFAFIAPSVLK